MTKSKSIVMLLEENIWLGCGSLVIGRNQRQEAFADLAPLEIGNPAEPFLKNVKIRFN